MEKKERHKQYSFLTLPAIVFLSVYIIKSLECVQSGILLTYLMQIGGCLILIIIKYSLLVLLASNWLKKLLDLVELI